MALLLVPSFPETGRKIEHRNLQQGKIHAHIKGKLHNAQAKFLNRLKEDSHLAL